MISPPRFSLRFQSKLAGQCPSITACATLTRAIKLMIANIFINTESHSFIISSCGEIVVRNPSNRDPPAGNKLIDERDRGDNQQEMDQVSSHTSDHSQ